MKPVDILPAFNAALNGVSCALLFLAVRAIRAGRREKHRQLMLGALGCSTVFLASYLVRFALTGAHRYPVADFTRTVYYVVLFSHTVLAAVVLPLIVRTLFLALKQRFDSHSRIARLTFPIWAYVSVTGVLVYLMLYQLAPRLR
ncbi:MAG: DUF420 domain-containing protein [Deltaproteobacteria bacterium]|nr:DUF420 domain-containing protein [Deltaproteobacteria bacterium]